MSRNRYQTPRMRTVAFATGKAMLAYSRHVEKPIPFDPEDGTDEALTKMELTNIWDQEW